MKNRIVGAIAIVLGGAGLMRWFLDAGPRGGSAASAYQAGYNTGTLFVGGLFLLAGLYYFFKKPD
jgi:hypothetical protein